MPEHRAFGLTGGLAQLGERLAGSQKVRGSNPLSSTHFKALADRLVLFCWIDASTQELAKAATVAVAPPFSILGAINPFDSGSLML